MITAKVTLETSGDGYDLVLLITTDRGAIRSVIGSWPCGHHDRAMRKFREILEVLGHSTSSEIQP